MKIFDYEIKNKLLALTGLIIIISLVFIPDEYGFATRVFCAVLGFICVGISTGNKKFISEAKALFIIVIIALSVRLHFLKHTLFQRAVWRERL